MDTAQNKIRVLHGTLEYGVASLGGISSVVNGLVPVLGKKGLVVALVTPGYDAFFTAYRNKSIEKVSTVSHIYKGVTHKSNIFRICIEKIDEEPIYQYMIRPVENSPVAWLFNIDNDGKNVYRAFKWSEPSNRMEYFNSALAAMLKCSDEIPEFEIYHSHAWHTGIAGVLVKEMENLPKWQTINKQRNKPLKKTPHVISTVHMLLEREHGQLTTKKSIADFVHSLGLPEDFTKKFSSWKQYINPGHMKRVVLSLLYSDQITTVSEGLANEAAHIKGGGQGLDTLFNWLDAQRRFEGILNGITHAKYDGTSKANLGDFALDQDAITAGKQRLKQHLATTYKQLDPDKIWFGFVGRFAEEKGMDMMLTALEEISRQNGVFVIMGRHVVSPKLVDGKLIQHYQPLLDELRSHPNVLIIDDPEEQNLVGAQIRAATDITLILSHNEACGLSQIEGFANGTFAVAPDIQGLPDSVKDLAAHPESGTGFLYNDIFVKRYSNLKKAIAKAADFYKTKKQDGTLDAFRNRIWSNSRQFDWEANPAKNYLHLYNKVLKKPLLTYDKIRNVSKPNLALLNIYKQKLDNNAKNYTSANFLSSDCETPKSKIFQIGFNKCGTQSLYYGFIGSNIPSIHYGKRGRTMASVIYDNYKNGRKLLTGIEEYAAYFDMEDIYHPEGPIFIPGILFKELDKQYPGSKFVLNTRDKDKWLRSRFTHVDPILGKVYAEIFCERYQIDPFTLYQRWSQEWDDHHKVVLEYFADRPNDLLVYNVETDNISKVCDFFASLNLDPTKFEHDNQSKATTHSLWPLVNTTTSSALV